MTGYRLDTATNIPQKHYLAACKNAVELGDTDRVLSMLERADGCLPDLDNTLHADVLCCSLIHSGELRGGGYKMAGEILRRSTPEQLRGADPYLITHAIWNYHSDFAYSLLHKGVDFTGRQGEIYWAAANMGYPRLLRDLNERGGDVNAENYAALRACLRCTDLRAAESLMQNGADFEGFLRSTEDIRLSETEPRFVRAMKDYWEQEIKAPEPESQPGMELGR